MNIISNIENHLREAEKPVEDIVAVADRLWEENGPFTLYDLFVAAGNSGYDGTGSNLRKFSQTVTPQLLAQNWVKRCYGPNATIYIKRPEGASWT